MFPSCDVIVYIKILVGLPSMPFVGEKNVKMLASFNHFTLPIRLSVTSNEPSSYNDKFNTVM